MKKSKSWLRKTGLISDQLLLAYIITFVIVAVGQMLFDPVFEAIAGVKIENLSNPVLKIGMMYFDFIGIWLVIGLMTLIPANRPMFKTLTHNRKGNNAKGIVFGILLGFFMNAFCVVMSLLFKDIGLSFNEFNGFYLIFIFVCVIVQSGAEELVCRYYLYNKLRRRYRNPWVAIIGSALFFCVLHLLNPGINVWAVVQILSIGILLAIIVCFFDSFWGAVMIHTAWNFTQNIIFGLPNSGIVSPYSLFHLDAASNGFFFDPGFGVEGTPGSSLVIIMMIVLAVAYIVKHNIQPTDIWAKEEAQLLAKEHPSKPAA